MAAAVSGRLRFLNVASTGSRISGLGCRRTLHLPAGRRHQPLLLVPGSSRWRPTTLCWNNRNNHLHPRNDVPSAFGQFCSHYFTTTTTTSDVTESSFDNDISPPPQQQPQTAVRLSKLLSQHSQSLAISRREAERLIQCGAVTVAGRAITSPHYLIEWKDLDGKAPGLVKVGGKAVALIPHRDPDGAGKVDNSNADAIKVWIVHKQRGEVVAERDPKGIPSLMERLMRGGVGRYGKNKQHHIKPIGRLDVMTEGLILVTTCGQYAREMELPAHQFHRTYRVRVHGNLTRYKIQAIQRGMRIVQDSATGAGVKTTTRYAPMKVELEGSRRGGGGGGRQRSGPVPTNCWIRITCTEGKNRQIRNILKHLGLSVTRLIRVSFGDYQLQTIPTGMALEVPVKDLNKQLRKGPLFSKKHKKTLRPGGNGDEASPVQWVRHYR